MWLDNCQVILLNINILCTVRRTVHSIDQELVEWKRQR